MEFTCKVEELRNAVAIVAPALPSRASHPVLANILIQADESTQIVTLIAFDLSVALHAAIDASVKYSGRITVPGTLFKDLISRQASGVMQFDLKEEDESKRIVLSFHTGSAEISGMDATEFPAIEEVGGDALEIPGSALSEMLADTIYTASNDPLKQVLSGICVTIDGEKIECAAIDGHRLAKSAISVKDDNPESRFVIHKKTAAELLKLAMGEEKIHLKQDGRQVFVSGSRWLLVSRLLEGQFPNYPQLIPRQFAHTAIFDRKELLEAINRVSVVPDWHEVVVFRFGSGQCSVSCKASGVGRVEEWVDADGGPPFAIAFHRKYVSDTLKRFEQEKVELNINTETSPTIFNEIGNSARLALIMPIQVRDL